MVDARCPDRGQTWKWNEYRPVLGENAWATLLGPLQVEYLRADGDINAIPDDSPAMQLAIGILCALQTMKISALGAIYYAPRNTWDAADPDIGSTFSTENQASALAGLKALHTVLNRSSTTRYKAQLPIVEDLIAGIEHYLKLAYKPELGYFSQGGSYDPQTGVQWVQEPYFALDCQTWVISVLGVPKIDGWFGNGTALRIWETSKRIAGYNADSGRGWVDGVGFSDNGRLHLPVVLHLHSLVLTTCPRPCTVCSFWDASTRCLSVSCVPFKYCRPLTLCTVSL